MPYTVTPTKTSEVNGITSQDAARAAEFAVGLATLTANQQIAADVTGNGTITSQDAARIAQFVAGLSVAGSTGQWKFVPASRTYASVNANLTGENYDAILIGDITGDWAAPGSREAKEKAKATARRAAVNPVSVSLPSISAKCGAIVSIPVRPAIWRARTSRRSTLRSASTRRCSAGKLRSDHQRWNPERQLHHHAEPERPRKARHLRLRHRSFIG